MEPKRKKNTGTKFLSLSGTGLALRREVANERAHLRAVRGPCAVPSQARLVALDVGNVAGPSDDHAAEQEGQSFSGGIAAVGGWYSRRAAGA